MRGPEADDGARADVSAREHVRFIALLAMESCFSSWRERRAIITDHMFLSCLEVRDEGCLPW